MTDLVPLRAWLAAHPTNEQPAGTMHGGEVTVLPDGTRSTTMPWVAYDPLLDELWTALAAAGWDEVDTRDYLDVVARWRTHTGREVIGLDDLAGMDRVTLFNALRWYNRGERFCDGLWSAAWQDGTLHAGARAVLALGED